MQQFILMTFVCQYLELRKILMSFCLVCQCVNNNKRNNTTTTATTTTTTTTTNNNNNNNNNNNKSSNNNKLFKLDTDNILN